MGAADFLNNTVRAEQGQQAGDAAGPATALGEIGSSAKKRRTHITITKTTERPFAAANYLEQRGVVHSPGIERPVAAAVFHHPAAERLDSVARGDVGRRGSK